MYYNSLRNWFVEVDYNLLKLSCLPDNFFYNIPCVLKNVFFCDLSVGPFMVNVTFLFWIHSLLPILAFLYLVSIPGSWHRWKPGNLDIWRILRFLQNDVFEARPLFAALELQWQERPPDCGGAGSVFEGGAKGIIRLWNESTWALGAGIR